MSEPLTPPDCDLRDYQYMPVDVVRLRDSDLSATPDGEVFRAAVLSWCAAWHQVPAASLTDDNAVLARLLGYGRDVRGWVKLRGAGALRGFVKCSDGRLYHPVVAEKALEGWIEKLRARKSSGAGNAKRHNFPFDPSPIEAAIETASGMLAQLNPNSRSLKHRPGCKTDDEENSPTGSQSGVQPGSQVKERENEDKGSIDARLVRFEEFWGICPKKTGRGAAESAWLKALEMADADTLIAGMRAYAASSVGKDQTFIKTPGPWLAEKRWLDGVAQEPFAGMTPEEKAAYLDRRDRITGQGKYAPEHMQ